MRINGKISAWTERGYGYVTARQGTTLVRYFLHVSKIISMAEGLDEPVVGCPVTFEPTNDLRRSLKDCPSAIDVEVGPDPHASAIKVLAGGGQ